MTAYTNKYTIDTAINPINKMRNKYAANKLFISKKFHKFVYCVFHEITVTEYDFFKCVECPIGVTGYNVIHNEKRDYNQ